MAKINKCELAEIFPNLGTISALEPTGLASGPLDDLFLCALGFEQRCLSLPNGLKAAGYEARRAAYFTYDTNLDDNAANLPELESNLTDIADDIETLEADELGFPNRLRDLIELTISEKHGELPQVTVDISVMANRLLLRCVKVLLESSVRVRVVYAEAAVYHPTKEEYDKDPRRWESEDLLGLERGVGDIMPSNDYPGYTLEPLPDCVILFPCFKAERSEAVIDFVDPSLSSNPGGRVVKLLGVPRLVEDRWRLEAMKKINRISKEERQYEVTTFDYKETLRTLETLHRELSERHRITISPLGSKMQALGTAFFCYMHPDVRVIFSIPKEYNAAQYSKGCKATWGINFGDMGVVRHNLEMVGTLQIEE